MADDIGGVWRTVGGRRIFIKDGQDLASAMKESGKFKENTDKDDEIQDQNERLTTKGGFLNYTEEDEEIVIDLIEVTDRKKGIGTKLIEKMKEISKQKNKPLTLFAYTQDEKAITQEALEQFYEKLGFEEELRDSGGVFYKYE